MLSQVFPIPIQNSLSPFKPKLYSSTIHDRPQCYRNQSHAYPPNSLPNFHKVLATTTNVVAEEEEEEREVKERVASGAGDSPGGVQLPAGLQQELMPRHVAVIMDGNVRWARLRGFPAASGHEAGVRSLRKLIELCCKWGIRVLTVFAFSSDNWIRPKVEVDFVMNLFESGIKSELENFVREGIQISMIGDSSKLPKSLQKLIADAVKTTKENSRLQLIVAVSYSGQYDIVQACKRIAHKVKDGLIQPEDINETQIEWELETNCTEFPYPDLLIRTSGELRVSNFLLWQLAYAELFFARALWPDFGEVEFIEALSSYQRRKRRYGGRDLNN
uniref:Alkyl transferase n=1 Tax=Davidia involucrata TaxID=16924 RepID=A0A5B7C083_DAVIN